MINRPTWEDLLELAKTDGEKAAVHLTRSCGRNSHTGWAEDVRAALELLKIGFGDFMSAINNPKTLGQKKARTARWMEQNNHQLASTA